MSEHISNFTDVLDHEIDNSQPISLPSSNNSVQDVSMPIQNRPPKKTGQKDNFRSIEEIDTKYRHIFSYQYFNLIQSSVIEDALYSDKSIVVCAPTGSGKTVIFEMAIVQLLMELEDKNDTDDFKIIYMAPVKALCTERLTEWYPKFNKLGILCIEVTGDTDVEFPQLKPYRIIITTPEKWDMLTRRWKDHRGLVEVIKLFLIDEVHILNDQSRGPVLEAVVSRMKTIESSAQSAHRIEQLQARFQGTEPNKRSSAKIRFVAVSATVSNPEDVAAWLGTTGTRAVFYKFGDECRPVKLKRVVEGYPCADGTSIFKFDIVLNYKLWSIIQKYHNGKPTLIFCNTRKSVILTAETLSREITVSFSAEQKMKLTILASTIKTKKIQSLILSGVGCHHAGLLFEERTNIERAFRNRDLPFLITTTTLAMGVNLPAHLVIIKNTQQYVNGAYQEYSISTVLQMVGRAGRPQYDTEATAVIMTRLQDKARYQALVGGSEPLQSYLHKRLAENLNSEAALGTVGDVAQCVQWVKSTFLSVRAARDPRRYLGLPNTAPTQQISQKIEELCVKAMNGLASAGLITMDEASCIESTEAGRLMSIYYLDLETMKLIMKLDGSESLERLLWLVCESHELSDMHLRVDERRCLNTLNRNNAAATIRFPMKGKINSRQMKLNCIIQAVLGCLPIPDPSLNQEAMKIMRIADRVCKCLVSYVTRPNHISQNPKSYTTILNSLVLAKCIYAHLWENSPYVSRQLKGIGPTFSTLLSSAGKVNFMLLEESHPRDLERIMNKGPPAGNVLRKQISLLPKYNLIMTPLNEKSVRIKLSLLNHAYLAENIEQLTAGVKHKSFIIVGDSENILLQFTNFKEMDLMNVYDGCITFEITRQHIFEHKIFVHCISSTFVGIDEQCQYLFKDINPIPLHIGDQQHIANVLPKIPIVESINTKDKKRKSQNDSEIMQSKEKKKRESNHVAKFKSFKKSFGKASEEIQFDLHKTANMSNKIIQNFKQSEQNHNRPCDNIDPVNFLSNDDIQKAFQEDFEYDEFVDDEQVRDILNGIENEIKICENTPTTTESKPSSSKINPNCKAIKFDTNSNHLRSEYTNQNHIAKNKYGGRKGNTLNNRNNYNFIDVLESKNMCNESDKVTEYETGFNSAVKMQIRQYLQDITNKNKIKTNVIDLIEPAIDIKSQVRSVNCTENPNLIIIKNDSNIPSTKENNDSDNNLISAALNHSRLLQDANLSEILVGPVKNEIKQFESSEIINENKSPIGCEKTNKFSNIGTEGKSLYKNDSLILCAPTLNVLDSPCSNELERFQNPESTELNNNSLNKYMLSGKGKCLTLSDIDKSLDLNAFYRKENSENLQHNIKYGFNKTNIVNITTKNHSNQNIQILGKLEINLNVTEIVYNNDNMVDPIQLTTHENNKEIQTEVLNRKFKSSSNENFETRCKEDLRLQRNNSDLCIQQGMIDTKSKEEDINDFINAPKTNKNIAIVYNADKNLDNSGADNTNFNIENEENLTKNNNTIKSILQKYNKKRQDTNNSENINLHEVLSENIKEKKNSTETDIKINKRKYRISDLDKIHVDFPQSLKEAIQTSYNTTDNTVSQRPIINTEVYPASNVGQNQIGENNPENQSIICDIEYELDELNTKLLSPELSTIEINSDLDVNETILNPKTLLQSISNDEDDVIIPPPIEFGDDTYSPNSTLENTANIDFDQNDVYEYDQIDIFNEQTQDNSSKLNENICLLLSKDEKRDSLHFNPNESFTATRKNIIDSNKSDYLSSRRAKLSQFKFKRKNMFHK